MLRSFALALCFGFLALPARARLVQSWSYEQLLAAADVVVVAKPVSNQLASDKWTGSHRDDGIFEAVDTGFDVRWVIKGPPDLKTLTVLHFRYGPKTMVMNGALFVHFVVKPISFRAEPLPEDKDARPSGLNISLPAPEYLLFLKKRSDGRMKCVTGQYDAALSCRELGEPPYSMISQSMEEVLDKK